MAGCFGNSFYDREMERQLYRYLDSIENCEHECNDCECYEECDDEKKIKPEETE